MKYTKNQKIEAMIEGAKDAGMYRRMMKSPKFRDMVMEYKKQKRR